MRASVTLLLVSALVAAGVAGAASLDKTRVLPTAVTALDETAQGIATATAWAPGHCESVDLWWPGENQRHGFRAPGPCPRTSTGRGIASVATDLNRVVWLAYAGGNTREWTLWTATPTAKQPRRLRFAAADVDAPAPIVLGNGGEEGIPYAVGADVVVLGWKGTRVLSWHAPARVVALAESASSVGVLLETGHLEVVGLLKKDVTDYAYAPGEVRAFRVASIGTVVNTTSGIEIRTPTTTVPLSIGPGALLAGFSDGNVVYSRGAEIRDYKRPSGADTLLRRVKPPFRVEFDRRGLAWTTGRHVCFSVRLFVASPLVHAPGCSG